MFKKILYPTSGSPLSLKIAQSICELVAGHPDREVIVAYAVKAQHIYSPAVAQELVESGVDPANELIDEIQNNLNRIAKVFNQHQINFTFKLEYGNPTEAMTKLAKKELVDVMVIGYHGEQTLADHLFKGNIMNRLIDAAPCPVLVVK